MPIWSEEADDWDAGADIVDPVTEKIYSSEKAKRLPAAILQRLINRVRKRGCFVMTVEECKQILQEREREECQK